MKGKYRIVIENRKIRYDFEIKRNITVIKGDSATGKTTLVDMISEYYENGADSGIKLQCDKVCAVLEGRSWKSVLGTFHDSILFIDEGNGFVSTLEFASAIQDTDNYYVIVTRESLPMLPYSVTEIYGIKNSGKYGTLRQTYNEMYRIYDDAYQNQTIQPTVVISEDSNAGFQFFDSICGKYGIECVTARGKSNIFRELQKIQGENILVIADGAAFGSEMERIMAVLKIRRNVHLFLPESFEWLILQAGIIKDREIMRILDFPYDYVESSKYMSWERYFTELLIEKTKGTYLVYSKRILNEAYTIGNVPKAILDKMEGIQF